MKNIQVKVFNSYESGAEESLNKFIKDVCVVDIKQDVVLAATGNFFMQYMVIYKEDINENSN